MVEIDDIIMLAVFCLRMTTIQTSTRAVNEIVPYRLSALPKWLL